jgi:hypothetical protein
MRSRHVVSGEIARSGSPPTAVAAVVDGVLEIDIIYVPARGLATDGIMRSVIRGRSEATRCLARGYWFAGKLVSRNSE